MAIVKVASLMKCCYAAADGRGILPTEMEVDARAIIAAFDLEDESTPGSHMTEALDNIQTSAASDSYRGLFTPLVGVPSWSLVCDHLSSEHESRTKEQSKACSEGALLTSLRLMTTGKPEGMTAQHLATFVMQFEGYTKVFKLIRMFPHLPSPGSYYGRRRHHLD